ncbi:hypothetical protein GCHA_2230 [Paraglaciecola chathamensis S18K6]|uniref:Uncharacterized protein n=1 Tax=Paraglaciecola chathamensis S18K6 TaxID=1127672 RepID=A0AAV3V045_9ALTE|nr:hypothetical protein GCHA_2230 [Paraglaciecola chathamensis S18K6]
MVLTLKKPPVCNLLTGGFFIDLLFSALEFAYLFKRIFAPNN